jgi:hypothetical protein
MSLRGPSARTRIPQATLHEWKFAEHLPGGALSQGLRGFPQLIQIEAHAYEFGVPGQDQCRLNGSIVFKDLVRFFRPVDLFGENVPAEAAGAAYALPLSQVSLGVLQVRIEAGILHRNRRLRTYHLQHRDPVSRKGARSQIVLQIECANQLCLFDDGKA